MKKLPVGISSFEDLRTNDYIYVDKTQDIHRLITSGKIYFLSRPRRFGKSLLVSTLEELFKGNEPLFRGLYIHDKWDWTRKSPVVRIDWGGLDYSTTELLKQSLSSHLSMKAEVEGVSIKEKSPVDIFAKLITRLHAKTGEKVAVLIDEYDKPIIDYLTEPVKAEANRVALKEIYQVLKACDDHIRFIFITGVTRFAGVSIFSGLNNLDDITLNPNYSTICGYTQDELLNNFDEYLNMLAAKYAVTVSAVVEEIRRQYDGFSWDGKNSVYNPFSTLRLFSMMKFGNYWFQSGTPTFLINLLKTRNKIEPILEPITTDEDMLSNFDVKSVSDIALLFQTGYLTVKQVNSFGFEESIILDVPNHEVRESLLRHLLCAYAEAPLDEIAPLYKQMKQQIAAGDASGLERNFRTMLASIPFQLHISNEHYYHSLLLLWLRLTGFEFLGEVSTNIGSIDAVWQQPDFTVVTEVKYDRTASCESLIDKAFKQIAEKRYAEKYSDKRLLLMGIAVSGHDDVKCLIK